MEQFQMKRQFFVFLGNLTFGWLISKRHLCFICFMQYFNENKINNIDKVVIVIIVLVLSLQRRAAVSGTPGAPPTCSVVCATPVGSTGRSSVAWNFPRGSARKKVGGQCPVCICNVRQLVGCDGNVSIVGSFCRTTGMHYLCLYIEVIQLLQGFLKNWQPLKLLLKSIHSQSFSDESFFLKIFQITWLWYVNCRLNLLWFINWTRSEKQLDSFCN